MGECVRMKAQSLDRINSGIVLRRQCIRTALANLIPAKRSCSFACIEALA
jgi:hypothetical protein